MSALIGIVIVELVSSWPAQAVLKVRCQSAVVNKKTQKVLFTVKFNETPDFLSFDEYGRQADSFGYYVDVDGNLPVFAGSPYYTGVETLIRGGEIHFAGDIPVRDTLPLDSGGPNSGGWGPIRGSVPYTLKGKVLTFSLPLQLIGDSDGQFSYRLEWSEFGEMRGSLDDRSVEGKQKKPQPCFPVD